MNEDERAGWLARAVDDLISGEPPAEPPPGLGRAELDALTRVARARLEAGRASAWDAARYERQVWQEVLFRLERLHNQDKLAMNITNDSSTTNAGDFAVAGDPEELGERQVQDIVILRQQMADEIAAFAEAHREDVWRQVRVRISSRSRRKGLFPFLWRRRPDPGFPAPETAGLDEQADDLIDIAGTRRALSKLMQAASEPSQPRVWSRVRTGLNRRALAAQSAPAPRRLAAGWPRLAGLAAGLALVIAALGPLPATGFADHPLAGLVTFVGRHVGVTESSPPPAADASGPTVQGTDVDVATAASLMGLPVRAPANLPDGFRLVSSRYFPQPLTADHGGLFALSYEQAGGDATLMVYQEADSGVDLAAGDGSASDVTLAGGVPGTYFEGAWRTADGLVWSAAGSQSVVIDHAGVRIVIQYSGPHMDAPALIAVADSMTVGSGRAGP